MSRPRFFKGPICGKDNCRSRFYYKQDGQTFCRNNHLREGDLDYEADEDENMAAGFGHRRKRARLEDEERDRSSAKSVRVLGKAGFLIYLQALQLILRTQLQFLQVKLHVAGLEHFGKQLWITMLEAQQIHKLLPEDATEEDLATDTKKGHSADFNPDPNESDDENDSADDDGQNRVYKSDQFAMRSPGMKHAFALCYIALNIMRVPVTVEEMHSWIQTGELLFMHARNILPDDLFTKLSGGWQARLQPPFLPTAYQLWQFTYHTAKYLNITAGLQVAPLNAPPVLIKQVKELLLPRKLTLTISNNLMIVDVFNAVLHLVNTLPVDLHVLTHQRTELEPLPRLLMRQQPETRLLVLALIVAKIFYNLDGTPRGVEDAFEPPTRGPELDHFQQQLNKRLTARLGVDRASETKPEDVVHMNEAQIDDYLDYFAQSWATARPKANMKTQQSLMPSAILAMFPIEAGHPEMAHTSGLTGDALTDAVRSVYMRAGPRHDSTLQPGEQYGLTPAKRNKRPDIWDLMLELGSLLVGAEEQKFRDVVRRTETSLSKFFEAARQSTNS